jgi:hypothetical protein
MISSRMITPATKTGLFSFVHRNKDLPMEWMARVFSAASFDKVPTLMTSSLLLPGVLCAALVTGRARTVDLQFCVREEWAFLIFFSCLSGVYSPRR